MTARHFKNSAVETGRGGDIFCTQDFPHKRIEALRAGAADDLVKPGGEADVLDVMEHLCGRAAGASA